MEVFPHLEDYCNCWPISDLIMMRLKYTLSRTRRQEPKNAAGSTTGKSKLNVGFLYLVPLCHH